MKKLLFLFLIKLSVIYPQNNNLSDTFQSVFENSNYVLSGEVIEKNHIGILITVKFIRYTN